MSQPVRFVADLMQPTPRQQEALDAVKRCRYVLYGGARGGGKSRWLRWTMLGLLLKWASQGKKGVRAALFCEDYPTLYDRQLSKLEAELPPTLGKFHAQSREWHLPENAGVLCFRNLDDPSKYQSAEFAAIGVDELTKNSLEVFNTLRGSLRWPGIEETRFLAATNPGGPGHLWVKALWIDRAFPPELQPFADDFAFIRAVPQDNPHLTSSYWDQLRSLPDQLRKAWVEGSWDSFEGQAFPEWRGSLHVRTLTIPPMWRWVGGMDWGYRAPGDFLLAGCGPEGRVHVQFEYPFRERTPYDVGFSLAAQLQGYPPIEWIALDSACWAVNDGGPTIAEELIRGMTDGPGTNHPPFIPSPKGPGSRVAGKLLISEHLKYAEGADLLADQGKLPVWLVPRLTVDPSCRYLIRTLPALPSDPDHVEDVDTDADDHAVDALRYLLQSRLPQAEVLRKDIPPDVHPGFTVYGVRRKRQRTPEVEAAEAMQEIAFKGGSVGGRYGRRILI